MTALNSARIHRACPACAAPSGTAEPMTQFAHQDWPMLRCAACGLVYLEWVPDYAALYDEIAWTSQRAKEHKRRMKASPILMRIDMMTRWRLGILGDATPSNGLKRWAKPGPVLDIGCSTGKAFNDLPKGYIPHGIEIETGAAEVARKSFEARGGRLVNSDAVSGLKEFPDRYFTGVTLWSYLEHEAKPREALVETLRVLKPDGVVLVKVPNFNSLNRKLLGKTWPGFRHPDHVQYFSPRTLGRLAESVGFSAYFRLYGKMPGNDNMYAILRPR
jgi:ubiquinone/menaquinone biosynthesis C-methylase UbiE